MNETTGDPFNTTATTSAGQTEQKSEGIVPLFIEQILQAPEGYFQMWGMTFNMVTLVGIVRNMETSSTKITYTIEDHTGQIEAHYWLEDEPTSKSPDVMINCYARLYGSIRQHGGKKTIMIFKMQQLSGANELTTHMLEVYTARYKAESYSQKKPTEFMSTDEETPDNILLGGYTKNQTAALQVIRNYKGNEAGISFQELSKSLTFMSITELRNTLDSMVNEGIIYTSVDSDHFLST